MAAITLLVIAHFFLPIYLEKDIFTMDPCKSYAEEEDVSERPLVRIGRAVALACIVVAALLAPQLASLDQVFQYIQEYTGFVSPGVLAIFIMDLFWGKVTPNAALVSAVLSIPLSAAFKACPPGSPSSTAC